jgi:hypothetical protein
MEVQIKRNSAGKQVYFFFILYFLPNMEHASNENTVSDINFIASGVEFDLVPFILLSVLNVRGL